MATLTNDEIIKEIDLAINELVYEKTSLIKAYNYYHGKRDPDQYRHLEENYGIGTPTTIEFVPLTRKHIDVLVGEYLSIPKTPKVSCKDKKTISTINKNKNETIEKGVIEELRNILREKIDNVFYNKPTINKDSVKRLSDKVININQNYASEYEIAGQNIIEYLMQSRNIDFLNKAKILIIDLLVSGTYYFRTTPTRAKNNIDFKVLNPLNTFIDRNPESPYLKDSHRAVIREYLTKTQILSKHGDKLKKEHIELLNDSSNFTSNSLDSYYVRGIDSVGSYSADGILGGYEVTPITPNNFTSSKYMRTIPVYDVEILKAVLDDGEYKTKRFKGTRIGSEIYVDVCEDDNVIRSMDDPYSCSLSINGGFSSDRNGDPFSLILATASLQD